MISPLQKALSTLFLGAFLAIASDSNAKKVPIKPIPATYYADHTQEIFYQSGSQYLMRDYTITDQSGKRITAKQLIKTSLKGKKLQETAEEIAAKTEARYPTARYPGYAKNATLENKIQLAKNAITLAREYLDVDMGNAHYTLDYEYSPQKEQDREEISRLPLRQDIKEFLRYELEKRYSLKGFGDSVQTFDEFYGPKDGKLLAGDCDDFSIALTSLYEGLLNHAKNNSDKGPFYQHLYEGLRHYKVLSMNISNHAMNIAITLTSPVKLEAIEPQYRNRTFRIEKIGGTYNVMYPAGSVGNISSTSEGAYRITYQHFDPKEVRAIYSSELSLIDSRYFLSGKGGKK